VRGDRDIQDKEALAGLGAAGPGDLEELVEIVLYGALREDHG
jgi:hypothetical protein